jgi:hypothetical protein
MDKQIDGQTDDGQTDRWTNRQMNKQIDGQTDRWTNRQIEKQKDGQTSKLSNQIELVKLICICYFPDFMSL